MAENLNPGSKYMQERGCCCPEGPNNAGNAAPYPPDAWWVNPMCSLHYYPQAVLCQVSMLDKREA